MKPVVYVVHGQTHEVLIDLEGHRYTGEPLHGVAGCLVSEDGQEVWGHHSSADGRFGSADDGDHVKQLIKDLTTTFDERRLTLEAVFPDGYEIVVCAGVDALPEPARSAVLEAGVLS